MKTSEYKPLIIAFIIYLICALINGSMEAILFAVFGAISLYLYLLIIYAYFLHWNFLNKIKIEYVIGFIIFCNSLFILNYNADKKIKESSDQSVKVQQVNYDNEIIFKKEETISLPENASLFISKFSHNNMDYSITMDINDCNKRTARIILNEGYVSSNIKVEEIDLNGEFKISVSARKFCNYMFRSK